MNDHNTMPTKKLYLETFDKFVAIIYCNDRCIDFLCIVCCPYLIGLIAQNHVKSENLSIPI